MISLPKNDINKKRIGRALYKQVKDHILDSILSGKLQIGSRILPELELMKVLGVSRMSVHRALRELAEEGYLTRSQGVGTFVSMHRSQGALIEIRNIADEISSWGGKHSCKVISLRKELSSPEIADAFGIIRESPIFHSIIVHFDREIPILYADRYINPTIFPDYLDQDFNKITPNQYLVSVAPVEEAEHTVESIIPEKNIRKFLKINMKESCLILHRKTWSFGKVATKSQFIYPGNRYRLKGRFKTGIISVSSPS